MATLDDSPSLFAGESWSTWAEYIVEKESKSENDDSSQDESKSKGENDSMKLRREDMMLYGFCPAQDELFLAVCEKCGQVVKPQALARHIEVRHSQNKSVPKKKSPVLSKPQGRSHRTSRQSPVKSEKLSNSEQIHPEIGSVSPDKFKTHGLPVVKVERMPSTVFSRQQHVLSLPSTSTSSCKESDSPVKVEHKQSVLLSDAFTEKSGEPCHVVTVKEELVFEDTPPKNYKEEPGGSVIKFSIGDSDIVPQASHEQTVTSSYDGRDIFSVDTPQEKDEVKQEAAVKKEFSSQKELSYFNSSMVEKHGKEIDSSKENKGLLHHTGDSSSSPSKKGHHKGRYKSVKSSKGKEGQHEKSRHHEHRSKHSRSSSSSSKSHRKEQSKKVHSSSNHGAESSFTTSDESFSFREEKTGNLAGEENDPVKVKVSSSFSSKNITTVKNESKHAVARSYQFKDDQSDQNSSIYYEHAQSSTAVNKMDMTSRNKIKEDRDNYVSHVEGDKNEMYFITNIKKENSHNSNTSTAHMKVPECVEELARPAEPPVLPQMVDEAACAVEALNREELVDKFELMENDIQTQIDLERSKMKLLQQAQQEAGRHIFQIDNRSSTPVLHIPSPKSEPPPTPSPTFNIEHYQQQQQQLSVPKLVSLSGGGGSKNSAASTIAKLSRTNSKGSSRGNSRPSSRPSSQPSTPVVKSEMLVFEDISRKLSKVTEAQEKSAAAISAKRVKGTGNKGMTAVHPQKSMSVSTGKKAVKDQKFIPCKEQPLARKNKKKSLSKTGKFQYQQDLDQARRSLLSDGLLDRVYDPERHCGVWIADQARQCTRSLTCKTHSLSLRRAVQGRTKSFDQLLQEHRDAKEALQKAKAANSLSFSSSSSSSGINAHGSKVSRAGGGVGNATSPASVAAAASKTLTMTTLAGANSTVMSTTASASAKVASYLHQQQQVATVVSPAFVRVKQQQQSHQLHLQQQQQQQQLQQQQHSAMQVATPQPVATVLPYTHTPKPAILSVFGRQEPLPMLETGDNLSSEGEEEEEEEEHDQPVIPYHWSSTHPRPAAVNNWGARQLGRGCYVFSQRCDLLRSAFSSVVDDHNRAPPNKKMCLESRLSQGSTSSNNSFTATNVVSTSVSDNSYPNMILSKTGVLQQQQQNTHISNKHKSKQTINHLNKSLKQKDQTFGSSSNSSSSSKSSGRNHISTGVKRKRSGSSNNNQSLSSPPPNTSINVSTLTSPISITIPAGINLAGLNNATLSNAISAQLVPTENTATTMQMHHQQHHHHHPNTQVVSGKGNNSVNIVVSGVEAVTGQHPGQLPNNVVNGQFVNLAGGISLDVSSGSISSQPSSTISVTQAGNGSVNYAEHLHHFKSALGSNVSAIGNSIGSKQVKASAKLFPALQTKGCIPMFGIANSNINSSSSVLVRSNNSGVSKQGITSISNISNTNFGGSLITTLPSGTVLMDTGQGSSAPATTFLTSTTTSQMAPSSIVTSNSTVSNNNIATNNYPSATGIVFKKDGQLANGVQLPGLQLKKNLPISINHFASSTIDPQQRNSPTAITINTDHRSLASKIPGRNHCITGTKVASLPKTMTAALIPTSMQTQIPLSSSTAQQIAATLNLTSQGGGRLIAPNLQQMYTTAANQVISPLQLQQKTYHHHHHSNNKSAGLVKNIGGGGVGSTAGKLFQPMSLTIMAPGGGIAGLSASGGGVVGAGAPSRVVGCGVPPLLLNSDRSGHNLMESDQEQQSLGSLSDMVSSSASVT